MQKEDIVDLIVQSLTSGHIDDLISKIDASEEPLTTAAALNAAVRKLYGELKDVPNMISAGELGVAYCLRKSSIQSDLESRAELTKLARIIAFNTAANGWPGWDDDGVVIEDAHIRAGLQLAIKCRDLALTPRERGTAHWLVGALELATGQPERARAEFERAESAFLSDDRLSTNTLMARGYIALARKANPASRHDGAAALNQIVEQLRADGSKDAVFFADQLVTADRVLVRN